MVKLVEFSINLCNNIFQFLIKAVYFLHTIFIQFSGNVRHTHTLGSFNCLIWPSYQSLEQCSFGGRWKNAYERLKKFYRQLKTKKICTCHFFHNKSHTDQPWVDLRLPRRQTTTNTLRHGILWHYFPENLSFYVVLKNTYRYPYIKL
jgi:hypothetical protein